MHFLFAILRPALLNQRKNKQVHIHMCADDNNSQNTDNKTTAKMIIYTLNYYTHTL